MSRRILLVAYFYPPCPDTGAHRPAAMAKYLRLAGHDVTVLTTRAYGELPDDAEQEIVRTNDLQLLRARLAGQKRIKPVFQPGTTAGATSRPHLLSHVLFPEPLVAAWLPFARGRALRLHRERPFDCVITTSPPESVHLVGRALQRRGAAWVADLRDGWNFQPLRTRLPTRAQRSADARLERRLLGAAEVVTCVTEAMAADARNRLGARSAVVPSGFEPPEDGEGSPAAAAAAASELLDPGRISIVYTGRFGHHRRDPTALIDALAELAREDPDVARRIELVFAGPYSADEQALLRRPVDPARIRIAGTLPREETIALQRQADALLLIYAGEGRAGDGPGGGPDGSAHPGLGSAKLFEYLGAGKPLLALAAGTEMGRLVAELDAGAVVGAADAGAIKAALKQVADGRVGAATKEARSAYAYPRVAERMAEQIERAIARDG